MPAIIACASCGQAQQLVAFLDAKRPAGHPSPAMVLGATPREEREGDVASFPVAEPQVAKQDGFAEAPVRRGREHTRLELDHDRVVSAPDEVIVETEKN